MFFRISQILVLFLCVKRWPAKTLLSIRCGIFIGIHIVDRCPIPTFRFVQIKLPLTHLFGLIFLLAHLVGLIAADREPLYQSATEGYVKCFQMLFSYYNLDESKLISDTKLQLQIYIFLSFSMSLCLFSTVIILFNNMCPQYPLASPLLTRVRLLWSQTHFCISCYGYGHHTTKKNKFFLKTGFSSAQAKVLNKSLKQTPWVQAVQQSPTHTRPISWLSQNAKSVQTPNTNVWKSISSSGADPVKGEKDLVFKLWL